MEGMLLSEVRIQEMNGIQSRDSGHKDEVRVVSSGAQWL